MLTQRMKEIKRTHVPKYHSGAGFVKPETHISVLRSRAYTEVWKETEGEPLSIRRAKAFARYLDTLPVFIRPEHLIVGYYAEDPFVLPVAIEALDSRELDLYLDGDWVKKEELDEWRQCRDYWSERNLGKMIDSLLTEKEKIISHQRYMEVFATKFTTRVVPDPREVYLGVGLNKVIEELQQKLDGLYWEKDTVTEGTKGVEIALKINDVKAMIIAAEAFLRWTNRHGQLAKMLAEEEKDQERKEELTKISEICSWVPGNPPRSFWGAVQSHWFTFLGWHMMESCCHGTPFRVDQIFWPWYEKDVLIDRTLPREKALEIMENYFLLVAELGQANSLHNRVGNQGHNFAATTTIGGVKENGSDACNELTILILDAIDDLRLSQPDCKFRWHPKVNPKAWRRCVEVIRSGLGQPAVKNDGVVIPNLTGHYGCTLEEARSWAIVACASPVPILHGGQARRDAWAIRPAKFLELAFNDGVDPGAPEFGRVGVPTGDATKFTSFEEVFEAFRRQVEWFVRKSTHIKAVGEYANNTLLKRPFASCLFRRSLDACRDIMDVPEKGVPWFNVPGQVDAVDSLISLKKLVFEDKKYTMEELLKALRANWEGYEEMRQEFINAPKFGNDDDFADEVARRVYDMFADEGCKVTDIHGAHPLAFGLVVSRMYQLAPYTGALPNGRKLGDPLADGGINPHSGYDRNGPMATLLSASKIDSARQKANIFNQKLAPSSVAGESGLRKLQHYIEAAMHLGLEMIQFNIVDAATLRDAQKHPEQYPDLVVRISGYNAHFNDLNKWVQDTIIERTEHVLA